MAMIRTFEGGGSWDDPTPVETPWTPAVASDWDTPTLPTIRDPGDILTPRVDPNPTPTPWPEPAPAPTPSPTPTPAPTATPGPVGGNYQPWFFSLVSGKAPTPAELVQLEPVLNTHGVRVLRNAEGVAGKIQLPNGQIVDVIVGASRGGEAWSWQTGDGGGGTGGTGTGGTGTGGTGTGGNSASGEKIGGIGGIDLSALANQYNDPYTAQLEDFVRQRLTELNSPVDDPFRQQYAELLQSRTDDLSRGTAQTQQLLDFLSQRATSLQQPVQTPQELALMESLTAATKRLSAQPDQTPEEQALMAALSSGVKTLSDRPAETPEEAQYKQMLNAYIAEMQTPGYTGAEQEVVRTSALDPIERDRQAAQRRMLEELGARGLTPDSGIAQEAILRVDATFDGLRADAQRSIALNELQRRLQRQQAALAAGGTLADLSDAQRTRNRQDLMDILGLQGSQAELSGKQRTRSNENLMAVLGLQGSQADLSVSQQQRQNAQLDQALNLMTAGVDITDARMREALDTASALSGLSGSVRAEESGRRNEALSLVGLLADLGPQRLQAALAALGQGESPASIMQSLLGIAQLNNQSAAISQNRSSSWWSGLGSLAAMINTGGGGSTWNETRGTVTTQVPR